jgi:DnaJ-class molecular chaperone
MPNETYPKISVIEPTLYQQKPYKCPVCDGRGLVEGGFYPFDSAAGPVKCRTCDGKTILWG